MERVLAPPARRDLETLHIPVRAGMTPQQAANKLSKRAVYLLYNTAPGDRRGRRRLPQRHPLPLLPPADADGPNGYRPTSRAEPAQRVGGGVARELRVLLEAPDRVLVPVRPERDVDPEPVARAHELVARARRGRRAASGTRSDRARGRARRSAGATPRSGARRGSRSRRRSPASRSASSAAR